MKIRGSFRGTRAVFVVSSIVFVTVTAWFFVNNRVEIAVREHRLDELKRELTQRFEKWHSNLIVSLMSQGYVEQPVDIEGSIEKSVMYIRRDGASYVTEIQPDCMKNAGIIARTILSEENFTSERVFNEIANLFVDLNDIKPKFNLVESDDSRSDRSNGYYEVNRFNLGFDFDIDLCYLLFQALARSNAVSDMREFEGILEYADSIDTSFTEGIYSVYAQAQIEKKYLEETDQWCLVLQVRFKFDDRLAVEQKSGMIKSY